MISIIIFGLYNTRGHKLRFPAFEKAQFVTALGIIRHRHCQPFRWLFRGKCACTEKRSFHRLPVRVRTQTGKDHEYEEVLKILKNQAENL